MFVSHFSGIYLTLKTFRGNQYVKIKVKTPTKLSPKQRELVEQIAKDEIGAIENKDSSNGTHSSFTINQAWKRLKEFLNKPQCDVKDEKDSSKKSEATSKESSSEAKN